MSLEKKRVMIVGGASGIGAGIAANCLRERAQVILVGRSPERLEQAAARLGAGVTTAQADATAEDQVQRLFQSEPVDHVVITAVHPYSSPVHAADVEEAMKAVAGKVRPALLVAKHGRFSPGGSLVLTSGINASRPTPGAAALAAANGAIEALTRHLAVELAPIRVNALAPGWVDTPVWDFIAGDRKAERFAAQAAKQPAGRVGVPADLAVAAHFLLTCGYVTGTVVRVDGGHALV